MIFLNEFVVLGKNLPTYEVRKNSFPHFKINFPRPLFTFIIRLKAVILDTDSILRAKTMLEKQPYTDRKIYKKNHLTFFAAIHVITLEFICAEKVGQTIV